MKDKILYIVRGIPGSGKSTIAKTLGGIQIESDQYFIDSNGEYKFDASKLHNAHNYCQEDKIKLMRDRFEIKL